MTRRENAHQAAAWLLSHPVHVHAKARRKPQAVLARVAEYFAHAPAADPCYVGPLFRNAGLARSDARFVVEETGTAWPLLELADYVPADWRRPPAWRLRTGVGRNVDLFRSLCRAAGRAEATDDDIRMLATEINDGFGWPLPTSEVGSVVRSVLRYRERWKRDGWHAKSSLARQRARGRRSGGVRAGKAAERAQAAVRLKSEGKTVRNDCGSTRSSSSDRLPLPGGCRMNRHRISDLGAGLRRPGKGGGVVAVCLKALGSKCVQLNTFLT